MSARHRISDVRVAKHPVLDAQHSLPTSKIESFEIGQNAIDLWVVQSRDRNLGGIFRSQRDAVHFVHHECPDQLFDLVYLPEGKELPLARGKS